MAPMSCFHLAAITDAAGSFDKAEELEANNFRATQALSATRIASERAPDRLVLDESPTGPKTRRSRRTARLTNSPQSPYAKTKMKEEELVSRLAV